MLYSALSIVSFLLFFNIRGGSAVQCGGQAGDALCPGGQCCSKWGWCGTTSDYCGSGCQSQCDGTGGAVSDLLSEAIFDSMLKHRNDCGCPAQGFYTYDAFIEAADIFPTFATTGDNDTRKREIAAFLAQTSHETNGGWETAPDGPYAWGYCTKREQNPGSYCASDPDYPCAADQQYYGRGPIQLSWNYNYGQLGDFLKVDLLSEPDLVAEDSVVSFQSALWYWMVPQSSKPSCHDVIIGKWKHSRDDQLAGRFPGYGLTTNIINGELECGNGWDVRVENRIGFYKTYCDMLGVSYGDHLDCYNQKPFGNKLSTYNSSGLKTVDVE